MKKKLISIRLDEDLHKNLRAFCNRHGRASLSAVINAALYHLLSATGKKGQKYVRNYLLRDFGGDIEDDSDC